MGYYGLGVRADISSRCSAGFLVAWWVVIQEGVIDVAIMRVGLSIEEYERYSALCRFDIRNSFLVVTVGYSKISITWLNDAGWRGTRRAKAPAPSWRHTLIAPPYRALLLDLHMCVAQA